jgi:hypothetical protein
LLFGPMISTFAIGTNTCDTPSHRPPRGRKSFRTW